MSVRELTTILASLRMFQASYVEYSAADLLHFADCSALSPDEIDALCERLNLGSV